MAQTQKDIVYLSSEEDSDGDGGANGLFSWTNPSSGAEPRRGERLQGLNPNVKRNRHRAPGAEIWPAGTSVVVTTTPQPPSIPTFNFTPTTNGCTTVDHTPIPSSSSVLQRARDDEIARGPPSSDTDRGTKVYSVPAPQDMFSVIPTSWGPQNERDENSSLGANRGSNEVLVIEDSERSTAGSPFSRAPSILESSTPRPSSLTVVRNRARMPNHAATPHEVITIDSDSDVDMEEMDGMSTEASRLRDLTYIPEVDNEHSTSYHSGWESGHSIGPLQGNGGKSSAEHEANDDSDDDIVVLDAKDVANKNFKPTSFERGGYTDNYNQPAPVHHPGENSTSENSEVIVTQLESRQQQYRQEHQQVSNVIAESNKTVSSLQQLVNSIMNKIQQANETIQQYINQGADRATTQKVHEKINNYRADLSRAKMLMNDKNREIDAFRKRLQAVIMGMQQTAAAINHFRSKAPGPFRSIYYDNTPFPPRSDIEPQPVSQGYSSNIYSRDNVDLQALLDNIKPDEDLEEGLEKTPPGMSINLMKHQRMGLTWLKRMEDSKSKGGILADDMGLGKTIQIIALMVANASEDQDCKTTLIVAPVSLLKQWSAEIENKLRVDCALKIGTYHGIEKKSLTTYAKMKRYDAILTSYGTLSSEWKRHFHDELREARENKEFTSYVPEPGTGGNSYTSPFYSKDAKFYRIVLDEAQNIKNKLAIASRAVASLRSTYKFCLSGTPMQNNIDELYPIIRFLDIRPYNQELKFRADISLPMKSRSGQYDSYDRTQGIKKLRAILKAILLRRSKNSLIDGKPILTLPEKHILTDNVHMESTEQEYYDALESGIQSKAKSLLEANKQKNRKNKNTTTGILSLLLRLRQACIHKFLVEIGMRRIEILHRQNEITGELGYEKLYRNIQSIESTVVQRVRHVAGTEDSSVEPLVIEGVTDVLLKDEEDDDNNEEGAFTCPMCLELVSILDPVSVLSKCGHLICSSCVDSFFDDHTIDEDSKGTKIAECVECKTHNTPRDIIDYKSFEQVHERGCSVEEFVTFCRKYYSRDDATDNWNLIQKLLKEQGQFIPSAKIKKCLELIREIFTKHPGEKVIIFSQFTALFDLVKIVLDNEQIPFLRYDGSMSVDDKNATIKSFYQTDCKLLLLSLRAGNVGLTLTCASHVVIMDPFWNPYVEEQAMDRAHRIGQEREVYVHRILIEGTVESRIMELQAMKKELVGAALDEKGMKSVSKLGQRELGFLFGLNKLN